VAFAKDGRTLAAAYRSGFTQWDTASYGPGETFDTAWAVKSMAFSPDSELLAVGNEWNHGAELWDVARGRRKKVVPGDAYSVLALQFSPDGRSLALGGETSAMLWSLGDGRKQFEVEARCTVGLAFSPDGATLATAGRNGLRFWSTTTGRPIECIPPAAGIGAVAYSPDGRLLATGDCRGRVAVWDVGSGTKRWSAHIDGPRRFNAVPEVCGVIGIGLVLLGCLCPWKERRSRSPRSEGGS
jgi:WD40 repeat protein